MKKKKKALIVPFFYMKGLYDNFFYGRIPLFPLFSFFSYFQLNHIKNGLFCFTTNIWCHVTQYNVSQVIFNFFFIILVIHNWNLCTLKFVIYIELISAWYVHAGHKDLFKCLRCTQVVSRVI